MEFEQPHLPYDSSALKPHMLANTFSYHYGKHHAAYVANFNKLVEGTEMAHKSLEEVIKASHGDSSKAGVL